MNDVNERIEEIIDQLRIAKGAFNFEIELMMALNMLTELLDDVDGL